MANNIEFKILTDTRQLEKSLTSASKKFKTFGKNMSTFATLPLAAAGVGFIKLASDAEETANKFNVVFRGMSKDASDWARSFGDSVGRSNEDMQRFSSTLGDILKPLGFTTKEAFNLSKGMTELALDVASFNNRQDADVIRAFASALTGERESLKTLGIVISEADVKTEAYTLGLVRQGEELTKTSKAQATYSLLLKNTEDAQGDLVRTQDSFANQMKRLQASAKDLGVSLGEILLPAATKLIVKTNSLLQSFQDLDTNTQKQILAFAGMVAIIGPLSFALSGIITAFTAIAQTLGALSIFTLFGLNTSVVILAANVGILQTSLLTLAGVGIAAFAGWKIGERIAEITGLDDAIRDLALNLNLFGNKQAEQSLAMETRLNKLAVARKKQADEERALTQSSLDDQLALQAAHDEELKRLKTETNLFIKNNDAELRDIAELTTQEDLVKLVSKFEFERNALLEHLNIKLNILKANGVLEAAQEQKIANEKIKINDKFNKLIAKAEDKKTLNEKKTFESRLGSLSDFTGQTLGILRQAGVQNKALELANAVVQQGGAIMKAWNSAPFPANLPAVAVTTAQTGLILSGIASQSFRHGTADLPNDMVAQVHRGEIIVPKTFSDAIRQGDLTLGGSGPSTPGGGGIHIDLSGSTINGITDELVEDMFTKASENIASGTLAFRGVS